jgi:hypothetical protein
MAAGGTIETLDDACALAVELAKKQGIIILADMRIANPAVKGAMTEDAIFADRTVWQVQAKIRRRTGRIHADRRTVTATRRAVAPSTRSSGRDARASYSRAGRM